MTWLWWAPLAASVVHIFEEFVYPGGFAEWDRLYRPEFKDSISPRFHVLVNAALLLAEFSVAAAGLGGVQLGATRVKSIVPAMYAVPVWLGLGALLFSNAIFHVVGTIRTRRRSPGIATGLLLYIPITCFGLWWFLKTGAVSMRAALFAIVVGGSYPLWSTFAHRMRAGNPRSSS